MRQRFNPTSTPPMGAYSQGISVPIGDATLVMTSGQIAADDTGNPLAPNDIGEQARIVFEMIRGVLEESGASPQDIVKVQIFITDMSQFATVSAIRNEFLAGVNPVSTVLEISNTVIDGCDVEIEAMAIVSTESEST